ncbi:MAG TPA: G5 domain-containing protein [Streptosporangiaceae bacterium]|nr:G5 domain-containing protein [Streptosporangiaceae bacterium]
MRCVITVVLAIGGLLTLAACGPESAVPTPAATASSAASPNQNASRAPTPVVTKRTVTETRTIPFSTRKVRDPNLAAGTTKVRTRGRTGIKTLVYEVTLTDGVPTGKKLIRQEITRRPVTRVIVVGTKRERECDPNYSGACVPIASDVDCAGGSGNGPAYVDGPVRVVGSDIYDLDRDGDGIACD